MVICHFPIFLSSGEGSDAMMYFLANHLLGGDFAASWFVFLVGVSQVLSSAKKMGTDQERNAKRTVVRGIAVFVLGLLFLLIVEGYETLWVWDILTFIGAATILLLPCRRTPVPVLLLFCTAVLLAAPRLRSFMDLAPLYGGKFVPVDWISDIIPNFLFDPAMDYEGGRTISENILGFFLIGQFPIVPWIIYPVIGCVVGKRLTENRMDGDSPFLLIIGMLFIFTGIFTAYAGSITPPFSVPNGYITPLSFYPLSFSMSLLLLGVVLVLFTILWTIYDKHRDETKIPGFFLVYCRQMSRYSLTIYVTHFALFFIPLRIIRFSTGKYYLHELTSTPAAFGLAVLLMVLYYPLLKLWDKAGGKFSFEWLLARTLSRCEPSTG